ncbi:facilitated trehalose transporter Tret1-like [Vespula squamosa]|uniref:Facilitated trehalose transporter Tret1-like n=1 Tax=Vespula squamosa TaxID=30214 RepID=A0ABD2C7C0_VESSQ
MLRRYVTTEAFNLWPQWLTAGSEKCQILIAVTILAVSLGLVAGWTSPYLAKFTYKEGDIYITDYEASWVASFLPMGRIFGAICGSLSVEYFGSKVSLVMTGLPLMASWICMIFTTTAIGLYMFRILSGTSMGMFIACFPIFIGEISTARIRGALIGLVINGLPIGIVIGNIMGPQMSSKWFGVISLLLTSIFLLTFPCLPKSPYYLIRRNSMENASKSLRFYHRKTNVIEEMNEIKIFINETRVENFRERLKLMAEPNIRSAFLIIIILCFFMQFSGLNSIIFYMEIIMRKAKVTFIAPATVVIIVSSIGIIYGWLAIYAIDRYGRKLLLIISSSSVTISMIIIGIHFLLLSRGYDSEMLQPVPVISMIMFMMICFGLTTVPSTLLSELFPVILKSIAGFIASFVSALFAFISSKTFQPLMDLVTIQYIFFIYGSIMVLCVLYTIFFVPETKGKTLKEIQVLLMEENRNTNRRNQTEED